MAKDLAKLREEIDSLDRRIVDLLNRRSRRATEIGKLKKKDGSPIYVPHREKAVLDRVISHNDGPLSDDCIRSVYRELMSGSLSLEKDLRIAFLGPPGTFSHLAARSKFGDQVAYRPARDVEEIFESVAREQADHGVVPCENTLGSGISLSLDLFLRHDVKICAELYQTTHLDLLTRAELEEITTIFSHPHAFRLCARWLKTHFPHADLVEVRSTAEGAQRATKAPGAAAVAHMNVARKYRLKRVCKRIEDDPDNLTRFFVLARSFGEATGHDRTSLVVSVRDRVGALLPFLGVFEEEGITLTKIESRMLTSRAREVLFFIDLRGHVNDPRVRTALERLEGTTKVLRVLGSYPAQA